MVIHSKLITIRKSTSKQEVPRYGTSGALTANGIVGFYWQSVPKPDGAGSLGFGYRTSMKDGTIATINSPATDDLGSYANGYGVRPVAE